MTPYVILPKTQTRGFRDPWAIIENSVCHVYYTLVVQEEKGQAFALAESVSTDLIHFSESRILLPPDPAYNYSSPGNVFRHQGQYFICFQTYPRPNGEIYGNQDSRLFLMHSPDLIHWSEPELIRVKGDMPPEDMGRMIDPYILPEADGTFLCFFKQNGVSISRSKDLIHWEFMGHAACGENVCVLRCNEWYAILHSPENGVGLLLSKDLEQFMNCGISMLGCEGMLWAKDRVTADFALEHDGETLLFFHGDNEDDYMFGASLAMIRHFDLLEAFPKVKSYLNI